MIEEKKLIMDFMGIKPRLISPDVYSLSDMPYYSCHFPTPEECIDAYAKYSKYDTSWDWLMPVVEKIEDIQDGKEGDSIRGHLYDVQIRQSVCIIHDADIEIVFDRKIDAVYHAVIEFIKWYNKNK